MEELQAAVVKSIDAKKKVLDEAQSIIAQAKKDDQAFNILIFTTKMLLTISKFVILKRIRETMSESEHNRLDEAEQMVQDILGQNN